MDTVFTYNTPHLMQWHWPIAVDLFLGGIGAGAFVVAALTSLYYRDRFPQVSKIGAILCPLCVIVGDLFLLAELGHPGRIFRTVIGFNTSSPFSWGGPLQAMIIAVGLVYAYMWFKPVSTKARNVIAIIGIPIALSVGTYHGWLLTMVKARPLWNTGPATIAALMAFATTGIAAVLLVLCLMGKHAFEKNGKATRAGWMVYDFKLRKRRPANDGGNNEVRSPAVRMVHDLRKVLVVGLVIQCVTLFVWWISLYYGSTTGREALTVANAAIGPLFWIVGIVLGLMLPAVLQINEIARYTGETARLSIPLTIVTAALVLVGGFVFRYAVLIGGQLA